MGAFYVPRPPVDQLPGGLSRKAPLVLLAAQTNAPFKRKWHNNYNELPSWVGSPTGVPLVDLPALSTSSQSPDVIRFWSSDWNDDSAPWPVAQTSFSTMSMTLQLYATTQTPPMYDFGIDDPTPGWEASIPTNYLLAPPSNPSPFTPFLWFRVM